jgi:hypothetical protein
MLSLRGVRLGQAQPYAAPGVRLGSRTTYAAPGSGPEVVLVQESM